MKKADELRCPRCAITLKLEEILVDEECGSTYILECPYCGFDIDVKEPEKVELSDYPFYEEGEPIEGRLTQPDVQNDHCINCGHEIHVIGNFMLSDYDKNIEPEGSDDKMSFEFMNCKYCGVSETRWDASDNDRKKFPYWKEII